MKDILDLLSKLGHDRIDLLKIDIEGAELDLLTKENSWLSKVNAIVAEVHPQVYGLRGVNEIVTALKGYGFKVLHITRRIDSVYALRAFQYTVGLSPSTFILLLWKLAILVGKTMWGSKKHKLRYLVALRFPR